MSINEGISWLGLSHDSIVPFLGYYTADSCVNPDELHMVSLWMENGTLMDYLDKTTSLDVGNVQKIIKSVSAVTTVYRSTFLRITTWKAV